jgi:hypothetical protein
MTKSHQVDVNSPYMGTMSKELNWATSSFSWKTQFSYKKCQILSPSLWSLGINCMYFELNTN